MSGLGKPVESAAGTDGEPQAGLRDLPGLILAVAALGFGVFLYIARLGAVPIQTGNEAMYAAPPIYMLESGDYLVPRFRDADFLDKPPLTFWLIAAGYRLFGISVTTARLPAALAALATALAVGVWSGRRRGLRAGLLSAMVLLFTYAFWTFTRYFAADAFLALTLTLAVISLDAAGRAEEGSDSLWGILCGAALAMAFMAKGLIGIALPVGAVAAGFALDRFRPVRVMRRGFVAGVVLLLLIAPWHIGMARRLGEEFWRTFYWENQFLRGATTRFMRSSRGLFAYLPVIAVAAFPWSFLLPGSLRRQKFSSAPLGWFLFGLIFWSLMGMKRDVYMMTIFPAIAVLVGERLDREASGELPRGRVAWILAAAIFALALPLLAKFSGLLSTLVGRGAVIFLGAAIALVVAAALVAAGSPRRLVAGAGVAIACGVCFLALMQIDRRLAAFDPMPAWGERVRRECPLDDCDCFLVTVNTISVEFYSQRAWRSVLHPFKLIGRTRHRTGFLVMRTAEEPSLNELPMRYEVLERRPWIAGDWVTVARRERSPVESLSLVRIESPEGTPPAPAGQAPDGATP